MSHVLHTVVVSYNRQKLLERTLNSYVDTVTLPHTLVVVDNGSEKMTIEWLLDMRDLNRRNGKVGLVRLGENRYPGYAANCGFAEAPETATLLHRSDNDMEYLPGWCDEVVARFENPKVGQVGLRTDAEERYAQNVGGNAVIRRELWDKGARYDERPWNLCPFEDGKMSMTVRELGYRWERVTVPCANHIGIASADDPYYQQTFYDRGITFAQWGVK